MQTKGSANTISAKVSEPRVTDDSIASHWGALLKRIDFLILKEIVGPWLFGVGLFTALIMAGTYLGRLTSFIVSGAPLGLVGQLFLLYLPGLLVKTFSMAMLLAGLLGFGRLSSDSEIVALRAGGASMVRIVRPVLLASIVVSIVTFAFNEIVVPSATSRGVLLTTQLAREGKINGRADSKPLFDNGKLVAVISAVKADVATGILHTVTVTSYDAQEQPEWLLIAPVVHFEGIQNWKIGEGARLTDLNDPRAVIHLREGAWPAQIPQPKDTLEQLLSKKDDYDAYTIAELRVKIQEMKRDKDKDKSEILDYEYGYYNKFSVAFAALVFGTLGAVLGIQNHRTGTASGFALAVGIIFGYITLANFMNVWAGAGILPPWVASFAPLCIGAVACGVIIYRRNT